MKVPTIVLRRTIYMVDNYLTSDFVINNLREKFDFFLILAICFLFTCFKQQLSKSILRSNRHKRV